MHKMIMRAGKGQVIDHINGNKLDNRKENLRFASPTGNQRNCKKPKNNTSGYKGVIWHKQSESFRAQIRIGDNKRIYVQGFETAKKAAIMYNALAIQHHGEFAKLNSFKEKCI